MILDQIEWSDCLVFVLALIPQLLIHVSIVELLLVAVNILPFLGMYSETVTQKLTCAVLQLPFQLVRERYFVAKKDQSPFVRHATVFQDVVNRCVKYAFAHLPATVGRVFFSKYVSLPFMRYRMLRNGFFQSPINWKEVDLQQTKGLYLAHDEKATPSVVVYYCHGGGFTMGSPYFYMEFLMAWMTLLRQAGFSNPAVFALDYTLSPEATYPTQVQQSLHGYKHALSLVSDPSRVVVAGDSAGGTLIMSLLLCLSNASHTRSLLPGLAVLISPWTTLLSSNNRDTSSDYLNASTLGKYAEQYIGRLASSDDPLVSPGNCTDLARWRKSSPTNGMYFVFGSEEVFAPEIKTVMGTLRKADIDVESHEEKDWIHAWPVVKLFLSNTEQERLSGLNRIVEVVKAKLKLA